MKKLLLLPLILLSFLLLTGCSNNVDYTHRDAFENKEMYNTWLKDVEYQKDPIKISDAAVDKKATRIEAFLPTNISDSTRTVVTNIEEFYKGDLARVNVTNYSFSNVTNVINPIMNIINSSNKTIRDAYNNDGFTLPEAFSVVYGIEFDKAQLKEHVAKDGFERAVVVAYLPVKLEYYQAKDKSDAVNIESTFIILPIQAELVYTQGGKLAADSKFNKFDLLNLQVSEQGLLK